MHKSIRITARVRQNTRLISFLVNTRVVRATVESAGDLFNEKYQRGMDSSVIKWVCGDRPVTPEIKSAVCWRWRNNPLAEAEES